MDEAEKILTKIANFNGITVPNTSFLAPNPQELREEVLPLRSQHKQDHHPDAIYKPVTAPNTQSDSSKYGHKPHPFKGHKSSTSIAHDKYIPPVPPVTTKAKKKHTIVDILKTRVLLVNFLIMGYCW